MEQTKNNKIRYSIQEIRTALAEKNREKLFRWKHSHVYMSDQIIELLEEKTSDKFEPGK